MPLDLLRKRALGALDLTGCGIHGPLPPLIVASPKPGTHLWNLNLSHNALTGRLPPEWAALPVFSGLHDLDLSYSHLTGPIPLEWVSSPWQPVM